MTWEEVTVKRKGEQWDRKGEVHVTGGKMTESKNRCVEREVNNRDDGRKKRDRKERNNRESGKGKVNDQVDTKRRSYAEAVIEGALRTERIRMRDSILRKADNTTCASVVNN